MSNTLKDWSTMVAICMTIDTIKCWQLWYAIQRWCNTNIFLTKYEYCHGGEWSGKGKLQSYSNKIISLYKATLDDMIRAFMQIAIYKAWLKGDLMGKVSIWLPWNLKRLPSVVIHRCWMMPWRQKMLTPWIVLWRASKFFGSTKQKLDMPPSVD